MPLMPGFFREEETGIPLYRYSHYEILEYEQTEGRYNIADMQHRTIEDHQKYLQRDEGAYCASKIRGIRNTAVSAGGTTTEQAAQIAQLVVRQHWAAWWASHDRWNFTPSRLIFFGAGIVGIMAFAVTMLALLATPCGVAVIGPGTVPANDNLSWHSLGNDTMGIMAISNIYSNGCNKTEFLDAFTVAGAPGWMLFNILRPYLYDAPAAWAIVPLYVGVPFPTRPAHFAENSSALKIYILVHSLVWVGTSLLTWALCLTHYRMTWLSTLKTHLVIFGSLRTIVSIAFEGCKDKADTWARKRRH